MNEETYNIAFRNALIEIKNAYSDLNWSFLLTNNGTVITSEENTVDPNMAKAATSFQSLAEKASAVGGLDNMLINGEKSKVYVSCINDMYLVAGLAKDADLVYFRTITGAVLPTILKVLDSVVAASPSTPTPIKPTPLIPYSPQKPATTKPIPSELRIDEEEEEEVEGVAEEGEFVEPRETEEEPETRESAKPQRMEARMPLEEIPSQQLIVDRFSGLMVKSDTVQLDEDVLKRWSALLNGQGINEVEIETFSGKTARCKTKVISDSKLEGRGLIRIPEKTCQSLDVRRGELVRVKPVVTEETEESD